MHHPTDKITHTTAFVTPVVEHWLEWETFFKNKKYFKNINQCIINLQNRLGVLFPWRFRNLDSLSSPGYKCCTELRTDCETMPSVLNHVSAFSQVPAINVITVCSCIECTTYILHCQRYAGLKWQTHTRLSTFYNKISVRFSSISIPLPQAKTNIWRMFQPFSYFVSWYFIL